MATANYVLLEKITVGAAGASSVTFSGIPQTGYTDLVVKASVRSSLAGPGDDIVWQFNNDTSTSNYSYRRIVGDGSGVSSSANSSYGFDSAGLSPAATATASTFGNLEIYIPNYTSSNYKSSSVDAVSENNATAAYTTLAANLWLSTAAITSIKIYSANLANLTQYSTFYLYGVAKLGTTPAIQPYATGGDTIMTDGTYWYHTFISSGTFTPAKSLTCDYLVVAGGGGGGGGNGASGGGAGGYRTSIGGSALSLGTSAYTVTIGAGGAGGATDSNPGVIGSNSVFSTITSTGGGRGVQAGITGGDGGSGGGGGANAGTSSAGLGTSGQGNNGGSANLTSPYPTGGGGGAGAVGGSGTGSTSGNGGAGLASSISGTSVTRAGGGAGGGTFQGATGGTGGTGGGGSSTSTNGGSGTANTGGGGAGGSTTGASGGTGGSGIVIVRYAV